MTSYFNSHSFLDVHLCPHFEKGSSTTGPGHSWKYSNNRLRSRIYSPWPHGLSTAEIDLLCLETSNALRI